jgi:hypothetical protein
MSLCNPQINQVKKVRIRGRFGLNKLQTETGETVCVFWMGPFKTPGRWWMILEQTARKYAASGLGLLRHEVCRVARPCLTGICTARAATVRMHVGLTGPLCPLPRPESWQPCPSKLVPHCPQTQTSNVLRVHKKGSQINIPECRRGFTLMQTRGLRFPPQPRYLSKSPRKRSPLSGPPVGLLETVLQVIWISFLASVLKGKQGCVLPGVLDLKTQWCTATW